MPSGTFAAYVGVYGLAALACVASLARVRRIEHPDTRRGMAALLCTAGGWAAANAAYLVVPGAGVQEALYVAGLVVGLATVGAWLHVCSAYTGRSYHRDPVLRWTAVVVFVGIVALKVTNPVHGAYYATESVATPFPHLAVTHMPLHWMVMGLSYALAAVGYFMLFEQFREVGHGMPALCALVAVTGLPVVLTIAGQFDPDLLAVAYEPLGVAAFAVMVLFVFLDRFQAIRLVGEGDTPVVVLDEDGHVRDANPGARRLFPGLADATGKPLSSAAPGLADHLASEGEVMKRHVDGATQYYRVTRNPFTGGSRQVGELVAIDDVTDSEQYRRKLERQNERLDRFASVVSHDLRNPLNVATGRLELARDERDDDHLAAVADALGRMGDLVEDLLALAREGEDIDEPEPVALDDLAERCWSSIPADGATLSVQTELTVLADPERARQLLENLFRNAVEHAGEHVTVTVGTLEDGGGFYVADDGPGIDPDRRESVFEPGDTTSDGGTGFGLAIVAEIATAHGWEVAVGESEAGGARFELSGVATATE